MSSRTTPNFCSHCGASLSPGDAFCSQCGAAVDGASARRAATGGPAESTRRSDLRRRVEDLAVEGWDVKHDYGDRVVMINRGIGSVGMHALLLVFTSGVGNLLYAWYSYSPGAERVELRADGTERYSSDDGGESGWDLKSALGVAAGLALAVTFALVGGLLLWVTSSLAPTAAALFLFAASLVSIPMSTQFAPGFASPTTFGRRRTTDEAVIEAPDRPCAACSRPVGTGVRRTYAEKRYVAGIPVGTLNEGQNSYCRSCANGEPFVGERAADRDREREREFA